jgi:multiple sugar transport system ATP-binding protein
MRAELIKLHKRLAATMVYVTHDQTEAMSMGDRLIVLKDGVVQQIGAPLEIYDNPANQFVAGFIGSPPMNFINCSLTEREDELWLTSGHLRVRLPAERAAALAGRGAAREVILGIRPEDIFERRFYDGPLDGNKATARVEFLEPLGSEVLATCSLAGREFVVRLSPRTEARSDEPLDLVFDMGRVKLFDPAAGGTIV